MQWLLGPRSNVSSVYVRNDPACRQLHSAEAICLSECGPWQVSTEYGAMTVVQRLAECTCDMSLLFSDQWEHTDLQTH